MWGFSMTYILRGLTEQGVEVWYTGKAGVGWLSHVKANAFEYQVLQTARVKASKFNANVELHGVWFIPMPITGWAEDRFDYDHQAWIVDGRYVRCGHPESMDCNCYGKLHEGELAETKGVSQ
jgi:hypothetical protein